MQRSPKTILGVVEMKMRYLACCVAFLQMSLFATSKQQTESLSKSFEGVKVSASVGYSGILLNSSRSGPKPKSSTSYGANGVGVQAKLGYDLSFCERCLVGLGAYGQYNSEKTTNEFYESSATTSATSRTFSMPWNVGLDLRLGLVPMRNCLLFIYGGVDWGYHNFKYVTKGLNESFTQFKAGGLLGAGIEQSFCEHWLVSVSVDYRWYGSENITYSNGTVQAIQARLATGLFSFGYRF